MSNHRLIDCQDEFGMTPIHWASKRGNLTAVKILLSHKARIDIKNCDGSIALHSCASSKEGMISICRLLIQAGSDPNCEDYIGRTPLHYACINNSPESSETVKELLQRGSLPDVRDEFMRTPLNDLAFYSMKRPIFDLAGKIDALLTAGANVNDRDFQGNTPLLHAALSNTSESLECFRILLRNGAELCAVDQRGRSILHFAAFYGDLHRIEELRGMRLTAPDPDAEDCSAFSPMKIILWRANAAIEDLGPGLRRAIQAEIIAFETLIAEVRTRYMHTWQYCVSVLRGRREQPRKSKRALRATNSRMPQAWSSRLWSIIYGVRSVQGVRGGNQHDLRVQPDPGNAGIDERNGDCNDVQQANSQETPENASRCPILPGVRDLRKVKFTAENTGTMATLRLPHENIHLRRIDDQSFKKGFKIRRQAIEMRAWVSKDEMACDSVGYGLDFEHASEAIGVRDLSSGLECSHFYLRELEHRPCLWIR